MRSSRCDVSRQTRSPSVSSAGLPPADLRGAAGPTCEKRTLRRARRHSVAPCVHVASHAAACRHPARRRRRY
eukprot:3666468-Prymnesium_polylepis.2